MFRFRIGRSHEQKASLKFQLPFNPSKRLKSDDMVL